MCHRHQRNGDHPRAGDDSVQLPPGTNLWREERGEKGLSALFFNNTESFLSNWILTTSSTYISWHSKCYRIRVRLPGQSYGWGRGSWLRSETWVWLNKIWDIPSACLGSGYLREWRCREADSQNLSQSTDQVRDNLPRPVQCPPTHCIYTFCDEVVLIRLCAFHLRSDLLVALPDGEPAPRALHRPPVAPHHHQRRLHHVQDVLCKQFTMSNHCGKLRMHNHSTS